MAREISSIAPWAEVVPDAPYPMSIEEFERWPKEPGWRYELVEGWCVWESLGWSMPRLVPALLPP